MLLGRGRVQAVARVLSGFTREIRRGNGACAQALRPEL